MGPLPPDRDDRPMWDIWQSQYILPVVTVADQLGVFEHLGNAPATTAGLASALEVDDRALGLFLAALASLDLVEKRSGQWAATASARKWLHPQAEGYWGPFLFRFRETIALHAPLLGSIRTGKRPGREDLAKGVAEWERGTMTPQMAAQIASFMHAHSIAPAKGVAAQPVIGEVTSLLDVGCGSGVYGIAMARHWPELRVELLDLKEMAAEAQ